MFSMVTMVIGMVLYFGGGQIAQIFETEDRVKRAVDDSMLTTLDINPKSSLTQAERAQTERERLTDVDKGLVRIIGIIIFNIGVLVLLI